MSRCMDSEHPRQGKEDGHNTFEEHLEAQSLKVEDVMMELSGVDTGGGTGGDYRREFDFIGVDNDDPLCWAVFWAMLWWEVIFLGCGSS